MLRRSAISELDCHYNREEILNEQGMTEWVEYSARVPHALPFGSRSGRRSPWTWTLAAVISVLVFLSWATL